MPKQHFLPGGDFLALTGGGGPNPSFHGASLSKSNTSIPSAAWTRAVFQLEDWDTDSFRQGASLAVLEIPSGFAGKYVVVIALRTVDVAYGLFGVAVWKNGAVASEIYARGNNPSPCICLARVLDLAVGDTIEARCYQDHAGAQLLNNNAVTTYLQLTKLETVQ